MAAMTKRILCAVLLAPAVLAATGTTAYDPPHSTPVQRPPTTSPPSVSLTGAPLSPAASQGVAARPVAEVASAAPAPPEPPCPEPYTCDLDAWSREPRPAVTEILVRKGAHRLFLVAGTVIVRSYSVALGWGGMGPKKYEGDGVTPTGTYAITDRLDSKWHTFLGVSYPSLEDQRAYAQRRARREVPPGRGIGFGIAIHGHRKDQQDGEHKKSDWTLGCVSLDNPEIDEVASAVKRGTRVVIRD